MLFEILEDFEAETPSGTLMLKKGQRVKIPENEAMPLIAEGLIAPVIQEHRRHSYEEITKSNKTVSLNRKCVICKADEWVIRKPNAKVSAIECRNCKHVELHVLSKR